MGAEPWKRLARAVLDMASEALAPTATIVSAHGEERSRNDTPVYAESDCYSLTHIDSENEHASIVKEVKIIKRLKLRMYRRVAYGADEGGLACALTLEMRTYGLAKVRTKTVVLTTTV